MLEEMAAFFEARLDDYDEHMLTNIASARDFYPFTAELLPKAPDVQLLDLGCGTGLELEFYFQRNPAATVTGVDLSQGMLDALKKKFDHHALRLICGSYFDVSLPEVFYDAAVSVESLHHFTPEAKLPLYEKVYTALKPGGYFILTDYFAANDAEEDFFQTELIRLKKELGLVPETFYHFDTPLTVLHEIEVLKKAGFAQVTEEGAWGATHTIKAIK